MIVNTRIKIGTPKPRRIRRDLSMLVLIRKVPPAQLLGSGNRLPGTSGIWKSQKQSRFTQVSVQVSPTCSQLAVGTFLGLALGYLGWTLVDETDVSG